MMLCVFSNTVALCLEGRKPREMIRKVSCCYGPIATSSWDFSHFQNDIDGPSAVVSTLLEDAYSHLLVVSFH